MNLNLEAAAAPNLNTKHLAKTLALGLAGLALIVALAGLAGREAAPAWAKAIEQESDHVTPRELADQLLSQPQAVVLVDVRPASEFGQWHLPGAHNLSLPQLLGSEGKALLKRAGDKRVVLVSNGMVHPGQAWVELTRRGHGNVRVLEGGLTAFKHEVLTPPSLRGPMSEERASDELTRFQAAQALFGRGR
ncbi:MAG: rhodanese-like domain-containing protein [Archangium sp.]|nr:rhodanese-like domain-containing protein [Archangium sp.]